MAAFCLTEPASGSDASVSIPFVIPYFFGYKTRMVFLSKSIVKI